MDKPTFRSMPPILPVETLELVFSHLERRELIPILSSNSLFHNTASRVLYHTITETTSVRVVQLVKTLASNDAYPRHVRSIDLDLGDNTITTNFLHLLHRVFRRLNSLTTLILDFSTINCADVAWIFERCSFSLMSFTSSMRCDRSLARFLATQPRITELSLRGYSPAHDFKLEPEALPILEQFNAITSCPNIIKEVLRGRPVQSLWISLRSGDVNTSLDNLLLSSTGIKRLTIINFGSEPPVTLLPLIADRLPQLEAFHLMVAMTTYTQENLLKLDASLTQFKALKHLTFMAAGIHTSFDEEQSIAEAWSKACPTLQRIILPTGLLWSQKTRTAFIS